MPKIKLIRNNYNPLKDDFLGLYKTTKTISVFATKPELISKFYNQQRQYPTMTQDNVYIITTDELRPCKIGISHKPEKRLKTLQLNHWLRLFLFETINIEKSIRAFDLEQSFHKRHKMHRLRGEWFNMQAKDCLESLQELLIMFREREAQRRALSND